MTEKLIKFIFCLGLVYVFLMGCLALLEGAQWLGELVGRLI